MKHTGCSFGEAILKTSEALNLQESSLDVSDIVANVATAKRMPLDSFKAFGAHAANRGQVRVARVPMYGPDRKRCSWFDMALISADFSKGLSQSGQSVGLFVQTDLNRKVTNWPEPGDTVLIVEGVKDAAALHSIGYYAIGLPGSKLSTKFKEIFTGCHVIIVPDRDKTGEQAAIVTAGRLEGIAESIRIATLPGELRATDGDGVREVMARDGGQTLLKKAISDAREWDGTSEDVSPAKGGIDFTSIVDGAGRTDIANARRFHAVHGDKYRFCHEWSKALIWDGCRWALDSDGAAIRMATSVADSLWHEVARCPIDETIRFAKDSSRASGIAAMLRLAASLSSIGVDEMDVNPWLLNCLNGTVDLKTGNLREHRREDNITKLVPTSFNPEAKAPNWEAFLERVFTYSSMIDFVQRLFGYFLTGEVNEQVLTVFHGSGSNGKSTLLNAIQATLGNDYTDSAPPSLLMEKKSDSHPTELAAVFGRRLVIAQESSQGAKLAEAVVKQLTGGDAITARRMREDFWTFKPTHKLVLCTNHKPRVRGTDHAIWRRLVLIPFEQKFWNPASGETGTPELMQDKTLSQKLASEREGILAWMVRGCLEWQRIGLEIPPDVMKATAEYRSENDTIGRFVEDRCLTGQSLRVKFAVLYDALVDWCEEVGDYAPSKKIVGLWLRDNGFLEKHSNGAWYVGIDVKSEVSV